MSYELLEGLSWAALGFLVGIPAGIGILAVLDSAAYESDDDE
ncbi:hypothetical protein [[Pseudomonas] boreopolis]